jgi:hypothetical protein
VGEDFAIGIGDRATFGIDRLFVDVFLRRQPGVLVVFDQLQINETKLERAKKKDKSDANQCAPCPSIPSHLPT